jgi:hypothetical protein
MKDRLQECKKEGRKEKKADEKDAREISTSHKCTPLTSVDELIRELCKLRRVFI